MLSDFTNENLNVYSTNKDNNTNGKQDMWHQYEMVISDEFAMKDDDSVEQVMRYKTSMQTFVNSNQNLQSYDNPHMHSREYIK